MGRYFRIGHTRIYFTIWPDPVGVDALRALWKWLEAVGAATMVTSVWIEAGSISAYIDAVEMRFRFDYIINKLETA